MHMIRGALVALLSLEDDMEVAELERGDQGSGHRAAHPGQRRGRGHRPTRAGRPDRRRAARSDSTQQLWIPTSAATFGPDTRSTVHEEPMVELSRDERLGFESAGNARRGFAVTAPRAAPPGVVHGTSGTMGSATGLLTCQFMTSACDCPGPTMMSIALGSRVSLSWLGVSFHTPAPPPKRYWVIHQKSGPGFCQYARSYTGLM